MLLFVENKNEMLFPFPEIVATDVETLADAERHVMAYVRSVVPTACEVGDVFTVNGKPFAESFCVENEQTWDEQDRAEPVTYRWIIDWTFDRVPVATR